MRRRRVRRRGRPRRRIQPQPPVVSLLLATAVGRVIVVPSSHAVVGFVVASASASAPVSAPTAASRRRCASGPVQTTTGCGVIRRMTTEERAAAAAAAFVGAGVSTATVPSRCPKVAEVAATPSLRYVRGNRRDRNPFGFVFPGCGGPPPSVSASLAVLPGGGPPRLGSSSSAVVLLAAKEEDEPSSDSEDTVDDEWRELADALLDLSNPDDEDDRRGGEGEGSTTGTRAKEGTPSGGVSGGDRHHHHRRGSAAAINVSEDHRTTSGTDDGGIRARRRRGKGRGLTDTLRGVENCTRKGKGRKDVTQSRDGARGGDGRGERTNEDDDDDERRHWDLVRFNMELNALARRGTVDSAERAERMLFGRLGDHCHDSGGVHVGVDVISFNTVLKGWAKCGGDGGAERAEALLGRMEYLSSPSTSSSSSSTPSPILPFRPNEVSYGTVVDAWARCGRVNGAREAERVLRRLREEAEVVEGAEAEAAPTKTPRPNARMYASVANGYGWRGQAEEAMALLRRMNRPDADSDVYASVIDAFANSGGGTRAAEGAEGLLREMEGDNGPPPPPRPDVVCYTNAIKAWARSGNPNAGERAETILRRMWPSGWGRDTSADSDADADADSDVDVDVDVVVVPNSVTVTAAMNAWANSGDPIAAQRRIERLLRRMEGLHARRRRRGRDDDDTRPDHVVYSTVIAAWARSPEPGGAVRAESVLRDMVDACATDRGAAKSDAEVTDSLRHGFGVVIRAHIRSNEDGSLRRAVDVLRWMIDVGVEPDECLFRMVFRGFAEAMDLGQADDEDMDEMVGEVLDLCLKDGVLDDEMRTTFKAISTREFFDR